MNPDLPQVQELLKRARGVGDPKPDKNSTGASHSPRVPPPVQQRPAQSPSPAGPTAEPKLAGDGTTSCAGWVGKRFQGMVELAPLLLLLAAILCGCYSMSESGGPMFRCVGDG